MGGGQLLLLLLDAGHGGGVLDGNGCPENSISELAQPQDPPTLTAKRRTCDPEDPLGGGKEELAELIQDDDGMYEILKSTSAGEQLAEHMKAKEGKKIANKILSAPPVRLS